MLLGAVPGLVGGTYLLRSLNSKAWNPVALVVVGIVLAVTSAMTLFPRFRNHQFAKKNPRWLTILSAPIGMGTGVSSAGAGGLGTVLLLNYSELTAAEVVGTDLLFGLGLAALGAVFHTSAGTVSMGPLTGLLVGGVPGVVVGCMLANRVPGKRLRAAVAAVALGLGFLLAANGANSLLQRRAPSTQERHGEHARAGSPSGERGHFSGTTTAASRTRVVTTRAAAARQVELGLNLLF